MKQPGFESTKVAMIKLSEALALLPTADQAIDNFKKVSRLMQSARPSTDEVIKWTSTNSTKS